MLTTQRAFSTLAIPHSLTSTTETPPSSPHPERSGSRCLESVQWTERESENACKDSRQQHLPYQAPENMRMDFSPEVTPLREISDLDVQVADRRENDPLTITKND